MYYSGKSTQFFNKPTTYGLMMSYKGTGGQQKALDSGCLWMLDNGAYSGNFDEGKWLEKLVKYIPYAENCRGIVAPDAVILDENGEFLKGDWVETLKRLHFYSPKIRLHGYPVAYALQDDHEVNAIPWPLFDVLFVAGCDAYKESIEVERIARLAKEMGKGVHIGRVSQLRRIRLTWWADSYDGTTFIWEESVKHKRFDGILSGEKPMVKQWRLL
jgi:hypothetical protein